MNLGFMTRGFLRVRVEGVDVRLGYIGVVRPRAGDAEAVERGMGHSRNPDKGGRSDVRVVRVGVTDAGG